MITQVVMKGHFTDFVKFFMRTQKIITEPLLAKWLMLTLLTAS